MATILPINVGAAPNDGTGDTLRNAMIICNTNFANLNTGNPQRIIATVVNNTFPTVSGTITVATITIPANTFVVGDNFCFEAQFFNQMSTGTAITVRAYVNTQNNLTGAVQIGQCVNSLGGYYFHMDRMLTVQSANLTGISMTTNSFTSRTQSFSVNSSATFNATVTNYLIIQAVTAGSDRLRCQVLKLTN
jgi:hypothetical protein